MLPLVGFHQLDIGIIAGASDQSRLTPNRTTTTKSIIKLAPLPGTSSSNILYDLDPDIELTLRRLRKVRSTVVSTNSSPNSSSNSDNNVSTTDNIDSSSYSSSNSNTYSILDLINSNKLELIENQDRTLKEMAIPDVSYELKSGLIHLLPKFHGLVGEDPHKHLKEFHAFPFSLDEATKDWLYLQPALFNTWGDMKCTFLEKFFPASMDKMLAGTRHLISNMATSLVRQLVVSQHQ
ncbi:hypothetical protein CR513_18847, partial [Mucuna pruriens]